jgi:hypothetical protein
MFWLNFRDGLGGGRKYEIRYQLIKEMCLPLEDFIFFSSMQKGNLSMSHID